MKIKTIIVGYLHENCYIISDDNGIAAVIDPGDDFERIRDYILDKDLKCDAILITHGHFDHIGAVAKLRNMTKARVFIGEKDARSLTVDVSEFASEGLEIKVGSMSFFVTETPGHSPGGVCYRCGDVLFTGDTLFHDDIGRTDLPGCDHNAILNSLQKLKNLPFDELRVLPGHEEESTLSHERENNVYMR